MNIYVGNLPYSVTKEDLEQEFSEFGEISSARIVIDRESGRSKGFGFVEMNNNEDAQKAIDSLNGKEIGGRKAVVNEAKPREERPRREGGFGGGRGGDRDRRGGGFGGGRGGESRSW